MFVAAIILLVIAAAFTFKGALEGSKAERQQAGLQEAQAEAEYIKGIEEGNKIKRDLIEQMAANIVNRGQSGLELQGVENIQQALQDDAERQVSIASSNAKVREHTLLMEARLSRSRARQMMLGAHASVAGSAGRMMLAGASKGGSQGGAGGGGGGAG